MFIVLAYLLMLCNKYFSSMKVRGFNFCEYVACLVFRPHFRVFFFLANAN